MTAAPDCPSHPLLTKLAEVAADFAAQREVRQQRRHLERDDFERIAAAGYLLVGVPTDEGGYWESTAKSVRLVCDALRTLAHGDAAVALVSAMHPAVLSYWLAAPEAAWQSDEFVRQVEEIVAGVKRGEWWGTITSEPGSGGDVAKTRATAVPDNGPHRYRLSGEKHFGSGSGVLDQMVTTAKAIGEERPDWFVVQTRGVPWDGSQGVTLTAEWDGQGMTATQSHGMRFEDFPAMRIAWTGGLAEIAVQSGPFIGCLFTSVAVGLVEIAMRTAAEKFRPATANPYEQVEWERAQLDAWLIAQAYEGMLRAVETLDDPRRDVLQGKTAIAELAETCLTRLCRILGGGTFHRRSPFGHWAQDVKALGLLRPPWGLAYGTLMAGSQEK